MKIIQVVSALKKGDGVGNAVFSLDEVLRKSGYETMIYNGKIIDADEDMLNEDLFTEDDLVIYNLSLRMDPNVLKLPCKKILMFHNITEPKFFEGISEFMKMQCSAGLYETLLTAGQFDWAIVPSEYSKKLLIQFGWDEQRITVLPYLMRFNKLCIEPAQEIADKYRDGKVNIVFTGRIAPNKKDEDIIRAFYEYHKTFNKNARLFLVGGYQADNYYVSLRRYIKKLGLEDDVILTGKVPVNELVAYYKLADLFLCMSEHEGFCIPLIEAMYFAVPIVAYDATAVPDTLGGQVSA